MLGSRPLIPRWRRLATLLATAALAIVSSIWNNQTGQVLSAFYDWKGLGYRLVGYLRAPNYLQDLTRDRAADGGNWNDRIDQIAVC